VTFSPDGKRLATLSRDNTVKVWNVQTGQEVLTLKVSVTGGGSVAFSPDGKRLASSHDRGIAGSCEAKMWDAQTGRRTPDPQGAHRPSQKRGLQPDGKRLVTGRVVHIQVRVVK